MQLAYTSANVAKVNIMEQIVNSDMIYVQTGLALIMEFVK
jgi:hypothetical protein